MRGDADRANAEVIGALEVVHRADARQQQRGQHRVFEHFGHGADPVPVGMRPEAVVEARTLQAVAVGDLDGVHFGPVECAGNGLYVVQPILVADGVHPVAQRDVLDIELGGGRIESHAAMLPVILAAMRSAVRRAAEVMMSRLPA